MNSYVSRVLLCVLLWFGTQTQVPASQITHLIQQGFSTPITKTIQHLQPGLSWKTANAQAWAIFEEAERTGLDWKLIVAVAFQESSFKFFKGDKTCGLTPQGEAQCVYRAFGPMHVYWEYWHKTLSIDPHRLVNDWRYGYKLGVDILQRRMVTYRNEVCAVGTFNSLTDKYRLRYCLKIQKHLKKIDAFIKRQTH